MTTTKRPTRAEKAAEQREAITGLRADLVNGQTIYVLRSATNVRVLRFFRVERDSRPIRAGGTWAGGRAPEGARLVEITQDVRRVLGLRDTRNGLAIPGGNSNPCHDTVADLASVLELELRHEEV